MCVNCGCDCRDITLPNAADGVSVTGATITGGDLIITLSNGTTINAGSVTTTASPIIILHNDTTSQTTDIFTPGVPTTIGTKTFTVPADTLDTDGSEIRATALLSLSNVDADMIQAIGFYINGVWFHPSISTGFGIAGAWSNAYMRMDLTIKRKSNTTAFVEQRFNFYSDKFCQIPRLSYEAFYNLPTIGTINFTTNTMSVAVTGISLSNSSDNENLTCDKFTVELYKKA
jgi:hypothetical protein